MLTAEVHARWEASRPIQVEEKPSLEEKTVLRVGLRSEKKVAS